MTFTLYDSRVMPPPICDTCGIEVLSWFSTTDLLPKVFCEEHHVFGGIHAQQEEE